jgi:multidrug transporter EmrE-like cation transporter
MIYILFLVNTLLMSAGQLLFKKSALYISTHSSLTLIQSYILNPWFYLAITCFALSTIVWVKILMAMKLVTAYPIALGIAYSVTAIGSFMLFNESLRPLNLIGITIVMLGIFLISIK